MSQVVSRNQWESVSFGKDGEDDKFRRLMGIGIYINVNLSLCFKPLFSPLGGHKSSCSRPSEKKSEGRSKSSEKALTVLEQQYETSRYLTHVARGAGLGYGSEALTTELPFQKDSSDKLHETL